MNEPAHEPSAQPNIDSPATATADEDLLAALADEFTARLRGGEHPQVEEYVERHPALAERIRKVFQAVTLMEQSRTIDHAGATERVGATIGRYKLLERIGEGGFGIVYMAEQQHPVRRKVALKVVKPGMDSRQVLARFDAERQALAIMDHPNIAKVFDAGATDSGRPYFVMELVRGEPITEFCDRNQFSPHQRLELFAQVCHAVQHAHQKGIIHRDLKPSNVLVAMHDTTPVVKVIDFGVAKALGQELTDKTLFTGFAQLLGTPLYMSPEQAGQSALDIDTRSDIYSLGVLLYELLTGTTPFDKERFRKAAHDEICRIIREEEPPKPSTRLSSLSLGERTGEGVPSSLASISAQRQTEPAKLTKLVRGDLDWIVMKALEKDRSRRYETANGLAADVQRYLADEPVLACPPSLGYRLRKFARRNRAAFATAAVVSIALVSGTVVSTWQAIRATRAERLADSRLEAESEARAAEAQQRRAAEAQRVEAEKQRAEAEANFQKARQAVDEYFTLVSESTLLDVPGLQPLRRDLLEAALRFYKESANQRSGDPDVLANLAVTYIRVAEIYHANDRNDDAVAILGQALDAIDRLRREYPTATVAHRKLAGFWKGLRRITTGTVLPHDIEQAFQVLQRLSETWEGLAAENPSVVEFQNDLAAIELHKGALLVNAGNGTSAAPFLLKAQAIWEKLVREHPTVPEYKADLADVYYTLATGSDEEEADSLSSRSLELLEQLVRENPKSPQYRSDLAWRLVRNADRHIKRNRLQEGEANFRRALAMNRALMEEFPSAALYRENLVDQQTTFAEYLAFTGRTDKALSLLRNTHSMISQQAADATHTPNFQTQLARFYGIFSRTLLHSNLAAEAIEAFVTSCDLYKKLILKFPNNPNHHNLLTTNCISLAETAILKSNPAAAEAILRQAKQCFDELATAHPTKPDYRRIQALFQARLAKQLTLTGQSDAANQEIQQAINLHQKIIEEFPQYDQLKWVYLGLANVFNGADKRDQAEMAYQNCFELLGNNANTLNGVAWALVACPKTGFHEPRWPVEIAQKAAELAPADGNIRNTLGVASYRNGDWQGAIDSLEKSMELRAGGDASDWCFLAMAHWQLGNQDAAREWYEKAVEWMKKNASVNEQLIRFRAEAAELLGVNEKTESEPSPAPTQ